MDQSSPNSENIPEPLNPESAAAILDEVIASVDLGLDEESLLVNPGDGDPTLTDPNQPSIAMEIDDIPSDLVDNREGIRTPVVTDNNPEPISSGTGVEAMETDITESDTVENVVSESSKSVDKSISSKDNFCSRDDDKDGNVSGGCIDKLVAENVTAEESDIINTLAKETEEVRLRSPVSILEEECLKLRDKEQLEREPLSELMEVDSKAETIDKSEESQETTDTPHEIQGEENLKDDKASTNDTEDKAEGSTIEETGSVHEETGKESSEKNEEKSSTGVAVDKGTTEKDKSDVNLEISNVNSTSQKTTEDEEVQNKNKGSDGQDLTDGTNLNETEETVSIVEKGEERSKSDITDDKIIDQKETGDSNHGSPDNTEFVTTEQGDDKNDTVMDSADDPIAGESTLNDKMESDECILPDSESLETKEDDDDDEQYIVTKIKELSAQECMQCNKSVVPKYSCKVGEKSLYLCHENCVKALRETKTHVIVRNLRVKTFAVVDQSSLTAKETSNSCQSCKKKIDTFNFYNWNVMNFCSSICLASYQKKLSTVCVQCKGDVPNTLIGKYSVRFGMEIKQFCKNSCLLEHKRCGMRFCYLCQGAVPAQTSTPGYCSKLCFQVSKGVKNQGICAVCKLKKVQEMQYDNGSITVGFCGDPCFVAYKFVNNVTPVLCEFCKMSKDLPELPYGFWMFNKRYQFCCADCQKLYIATSRKIVHCKTCNVKKYDFDMISIMNSAEKMTVCSLNCFNLINLNSKNVKNKCDLCYKHVKPQFYLRTLDNIVHNFCTAECLKIFKDHLNKISNEEIITEATPIPEDQAVQKVKKIVVVRPREVPLQRNVATMCKPNMTTKAISCKPRQSTASCQTESFNNKFIIPLPIPIYVPIPLAMFSQPVPCPFPIPIPLPVPIFIPTRRNSMKGIQKEITKIKNKTPANPLEAELLMMAEMVAEDKKNSSDSDSDTDAPPKLKPEAPYGDEPMETNNFGEDVIQMALKMAGDFDTPPDLEVKTEDSTQRIENIMDTKRRNIRQARQGKLKKSPVPESSSENEKPDLNMCLKYTFGVNAWKQWVTTKNLELQKTSKKPKLFKTEILHLTADELNFSLCLFVKEVRKPNGSEYAPDTIYYLCLGIQQYLYENSRIDNIFCDPFYDKFTDCLNEVCQKFSVLYNESQYIVTRVEEEHLWEAKQLGAHSPLVLLNTLMFFNTKHFSLTTVTEHLQLSFSHIMKHWKRNPHQPGSRNVLLRFYPPQSADGTRKKKVCEQHENDVNPIRCPVKLYEFYLSKCPESVKTRNDVFYLQPERSCVPDSPVWYSTMAQDQEPLEKMLNRVKMVKEINIAILTT